MGNYFLPSLSTERTLTPWWTFTGTWTHEQNDCISQKNVYSGGTVSTATLVFTGTEISIIHRKGSNGSANGVTVTIDGVSKTPPNFYNAATTYNNVTTYSELSAGEHTMVITADPTAGKYCFLSDALVKNPVESGDKGCYVYDFGMPSIATSAFVSSASAIVPITGAQLVMIELGINDRANPAQFLANMRTILTAISASTTTSILLVAANMISDANAANYKTIIGYMYQLADEYNCAVVDMYDRWGEYAVAQAQGLMGETTYTGNAGLDLYHPSDKGHRDYAHAIAANILQ